MQKDILIWRRRHCPATRPFRRSRRSRHFSRNIRVLRADRIQTRDLPLACNLLYHCTTHSLVSILHFFPTYYTKPSINYLFEILNECKSKSCQLKSFITIWDLQLLSLPFPHPRSFTKFKSHLVMYQIYGTWQSLAFAVCLDLAHGKAFLCRVPWSGTRQISNFF